MLRRNFLSSLGILPFFSFKKKDKKNPNNLPVVKFNEKGRMINHKELLNGKAEVLVFVREEDKVGYFCYGEMMLNNKKWYYKLDTTKNTKHTTTNYNSVSLYDPS